MDFQINTVGLNTISKERNKQMFSAYVYFPLMVVLIFLLRDRLYFMAVIIFTTTFSFIWLVYIPLFKKGKLWNSLVTEIKLNDAGYTFITAKTVIFRSREVAIPLGQLKIDKSEAFKIYPRRLAIKSEEDKEIILYVIKDFFNDYDTIERKLKSVC